MPALREDRKAIVIAEGNSLPVSDSCPPALRILERNYPLVTSLYCLSNRSWPVLSYQDGLGRYATVRDVPHFVGEAPPIMGLH